MLSNFCIHKFRRVCVLNLTPRGWNLYYLKIHPRRISPVVTGIFHCFSVIFALFIHPQHRPFRLNKLHAKLFRLLQFSSIFLSPHFDGSARCVSMLFSLLLNWITWMVLLLEHTRNPSLNENCTYCVCINDSKQSKDEKTFCSSHLF